MLTEEDCDSLLSFMCEEEDLCLSGLRMDLAVVVACLCVSKVADVFFFLWIKY